MPSVRSIRMAIGSLLPPLFATFSAAGVAADKRYLQDFEFIDETVRARGASVQSKKIDWKAVTAEMRPRFARCASDVEHVRNVMELLARLRDSHTGVTRSSVDWGELPGKFDGLYGGGLWFGWDRGRFVLRGVMKGHELDGVVPPGAVLVAIDGEPAWLAMARVAARIKQHRGVSSDHSLFASLSNRMLPFADAPRLPVTFVLPDGDAKSVTVPRWGPGGKAFHPSEVQLPEGVERGDGAVSGWLDLPQERVGYLRITGSMDDATARAFHAALDELDGLRALLLDCRSMGGGGDGAAWEMCGRFFKDGADNGRNGRIEPTGTWQFDGPIVMLQNESMVSSAETFTWAMSETGRAVTVGRPTGGWGIIPNRFSCPSGLIDFRLGVNDRPTPIRGVRTEGIGWPPDVLLRFGPAFGELGDPARALAVDMVGLMVDGVRADVVHDAFSTLVAGDTSSFERHASGFEKKSPWFDADAWIKRVRRDLDAEIEIELACLKLDDDGALPDLVGASERLADLTKRARAAGLGKRVGSLKKRIGAARKELAAQEALLELVHERRWSEEKSRAAWLKKYGKTAIGRLMRERSK